MKKEIWLIESGKLVCHYETWHGKKGFKVFELFKQEYKYDTDYYQFRENGTKYHITQVSYNNLTKCYTPLYNNTKFNAFIDADLSILKN